MSQRDDIDWLALSEAQETFEAANPGRPYAGPLPQAVARGKLEQERTRYAAGDSMALLGAISICARNELPIPAWAATAYLKAYREVLNCRAGSWDEVLGKPHARKHIKGLRQRRELRPKIWLRVRQIRDTEPSQAIDRSMFERVAEELGIGRTLCEALYYSFPTKRAHE